MVLDDLEVDVARPWWELWFQCYHLDVQLVQQFILVVDQIC